MRRRIAIRRAMKKIDKETERRGMAGRGGREGVGGAQGLVDEGLHSWMVQGDREAGRRGEEATANREDNATGLVKKKIYIQSSCK